VPSGKIVKGWEIVCRTKKGGIIGIDGGNVRCESGPDTAAAAADDNCASSTEAWTEAKLCPSMTVRLSAETGAFSLA